VERHGSRDSVLDPMDGEEVVEGRCPSIVAVLEKR
jgi:hypothetical protein